MKKALVVLYSPKTLNDFLWYYSQLEEEYEWTAVLQGIGANGEIEIENLSKQSGIFNRIICDYDRFDTKSILEKMGLFFQMFFCYLFRQQSKFAKKVLKKRVGNQNFSLIVVAPSETIVQGACICLAKEIRVVLLEDGLSDYLEHSKKFNPNYGIDLENILGYLLAKMGYANISVKYWMENNRYCDKYCCYPGKLIDREFRSIHKLWDEQKNNQAYLELAKKTFMLNEITDTEDCVVLYTTPLGDFLEDEALVTKLEQETISYIKNTYHCKRILLKRHPRDGHAYHFSDDVEMVEVDKLIPAELLINTLKKNTSVFMFVSTMIMTFGDDLDQVDVLFYQEIEHYRQKTDYKNAFARCAASFPGIHITEI